ncbi:hypothetical protein H4S06_001024 [Coemansia sp. BCRC 34490]|nr:hypothetical protein H4S06_001024 [Coemansia sp. BCRC 34490]
MEIAKPIARLMQRVFGKKTEKQQEALVSVIASLRPRVATRPSVYDYMGNLVTARFVTVPLELITADPDASALARIAGHIRDGVNATDAEYICQVGHLVSKRPEGYVQFFMGLIEYKYNMVVSSQVLFDHYDVDFGMGIPVLVRPAHLSFPNSILIMPCYPGTDGYEISMTLTAEVAAKTIQDQHWMSLVDRCDYDV